MRYTNLNVVGSKLVAGLVHSTTEQKRASYNMSQVPRHGGVTLLSTQEDT